MSTNPIYEAVLPLKEDAMERARREAAIEVEKVDEELAKAGWDINKAAPYPAASFGLPAPAFYTARAKHNRFHALAVADPALPYQSSDGKSPYFVVVDKDRVARYIERRMADAATDYDAFIAKLIKKIGPVKSAKLTGNHVWDHSHLLVVTEAGETQVWKTHQIVNYSKLGKPFQQWPTRKLKHVPKMLTHG